MSKENIAITSNKEQAQQIKIEVEPGYDKFLPYEFRKNPIEYFERLGINVKSGEIKRDESGRVREDPTAVKDLPDLSDGKGNVLRLVAKRVNTEKGQIKKTADPFLEYKILQLCREFGLPAAKPIAKVEQGKFYLILMERIDGVRWGEKKSLRFKERGYTDEDLERLKKEAEDQMAKLKERFSKAGIIRDFKLKDMIFDIDLENKKMRELTPTDWERTKIDWKKINEIKAIK